AVERLFERDFAVRVRSDSIVVALLPYRSHEHDRHEQGNRSNDLAWRKLLSAECLAEEPEYDDDSDEARRHQEDRGGQAHDCEQKHLLEGRCKALGARPFGGPTEVDR